MISHITAGFRAHYRKLPSYIQKQAVTNYKQWKKDSRHPSLYFKRVSSGSNTWAVRVGIGYRALGVIKGNVIVWFWIGSHAEYDYLLKRL